MLTMCVCAKQRSVSTQAQVSKPGNLPLARQSRKSPEGRLLGKWHFYLLFNVIIHVIFNKTARLYASKNEHGYSFQSYEKSQMTRNRLITF